MEELKLLVEMVASLPQAAIWVLVLFFCYKTIVIGSIYGVIRLSITLLHSWATKPKVIEYTLHGEPINIEVATLIRREISRIKSSAYIHASDVEKLSLALDIVDLANDSFSDIKFVKEQLKVRRQNSETKI